MELSPAHDNDHGAETYVTAFKALIDGPLAAFLEASKTIGGDVSEQAIAFAGAWEAEAEFLAKAIAMPKPDDIQDMLAPIAAKMGEVGAVVEKVDPRGPLAQHCNALGESVAALGWVAVEEKATVYVGDMAGAGQFFMDKVKMGAKKTDNPEAHRAWAKSLEALFADLKSYVKEYHTQKLVWNPPKVARVARASVANDGEGDSEVSDYVTAFKEIIDGPLATFVQASQAIGGEVAEQAAAFAGAWKAEAEFLAKAIAMPKPDDIQDMLAPIAAKMGEVGAVVEKVDPRGPLAQHCNALGESVAALGWVAVEEKATVYVGDMAGAGQFFMDKVKMGAKKTDNPEAHRAWAKSLEALFADLKSYVKEYHTQKLVWNPPKVARVARASVANDGEGDSEVSDYVTAFKEIIDGPLATFVQASQAIGGEVAEQAAAFAGAWKAEAEFLAKAIAMPKPDDIQDMLAPIAAKMGEVGAVVEKVDPRGPLAQHCNALGESVAALGWVAVEEKATVYVGDMAGAGQFFMDKVKMGAKKTDNPEAHRAWAKSLEALFADLKSYVKEYHTQKLVWNPPKAVRAIRSVVSGGEGDGSSNAIDYVSAFKDIINGPLADFVQASIVIGDDVAEQANAFAGAWEAEAEFLAKAITMPKPDDIQDMLAPIAAKMGEVGAIVEKVDPRGPLSQHCNAVGESVAALGWIAVDEKATSFVGDMAGAGQFFLDKVKMAAKKTDNPEAQRAWAKSLETVFADLKSYVKEYHTQRLVWNPPKITQATRRAAIPDQDNQGSSSSDYVAAFKNIIDGPLVSFLDSSKTIGGEVADQATAFAAAWRAEADFLGKSISMPKPDDIQDMLAPIAAKMGEVGEIVEKVDPRGPYAHHCNALGESVAALGWIAVDEKATGFVGDMAGAGQFFLDKVKMGAKKTNNSEAHRAWAKSLETLFVDLKAYVKQYHTQQLVWNCHKS